MRKTGFTLIELLLVLVLLGIVIGISMPYFVHSIRGNRLRAAGRTLVTVARYARSMAVLKQSDLTLVFDLDQGLIDLHSSNAVLPSFSRAVEGVQIESVTLQSMDTVREGVVQVPYYRTGFCQPFEVRIIDPHGNVLLVKIDALSTARVIAD